MSKILRCLFRFAVARRGLFSANYTHNFGLFSFPNLEVKFVLSVFEIRL